MLEIRNVAKRFHSRGTTVTALDNFDLTVRPGEFLTIVGPSGCGKSTLLNLVSGLVGTTEGELLLNGQRIRGVDRDVGYITQSDNLFPWRTTLNNVLYGLEIQGMPKAERTARARELLKLVGLETHADHYPSELSGGQKQRVGIARSLAIEPKLLLMDEPFGALDALTREYLQGELQRICAERDLTVLFVTHSIDEAIFLSDRIMVMGVNPGRIIAEFSINLPKPRGEYNFRAEAEYAVLREQIWELLQSELIQTEAGIERSP